MPGRLAWIMPIKVVIEIDILVEAHYSVLPVVLKHLGSYKDL